MRAYRTKETLGKIGENTLRAWAGEVGLVVNESGDDRAGWDFILESAPEAGDERPAIPFGHSDSFPLRARVQVKATDKGDGFIDVKLSNWLRLVEDPNPAFFFVVELDGKNTPQRAFLVHVDEPHWRKVLHRRRQNEVGKKKPLHKLRLRLNYAEGRLLDRLDGQGLLAALTEAIGSSGSAYSEQKLRTIRHMGFEEGNASVRIVFPEGEDVTPVAQLADLEIGLTPRVPFSRAEFYPLRYGMIDETAALVIQRGSIVTPSPQPRASVDVRFAAPKLAQEVRFGAELFAPTALAAAIAEGRSLDGLALRASAPFFEAVARWGGESTLTYHTPEPEEIVLIRDLHTVARLTQLYIEAAREQTEIELEVSYNGNRLVLLGGSLPPLTISSEEQAADLAFCELIETTWWLLRQFEVEDRAHVSIAGLARASSDIGLFAEIVKGQTGGTLTFSWNPQEGSDVLDLRDQASDVVLATEIVVGDQRLTAAIHFVGKLAIDTQREDEWIAYRVDYSGTDSPTLYATRSDSAAPEIGPLAMQTVRALGRKAIILAIPLTSPGESALEAT